MTHRELEDPAGARLLIWSNALEYCQNLLNFAVKALHASGAQAERERLMHPLVMSKAKELEQADPDKISGMTKMSYYVDSKNALLPSFGSLEDLHTAIESSRLLAIVVFNQISNIGFGEAGHVAGNSEDFRDEHMPAIEAMAFPEQQDLESFRLLKVALKDARNNMIAHAHGASYRTSMEALPGKLLLWQVGNALDGIDFGLFRRAVGSMAEALRAYLRQRAA